MASIVQEPALTVRKLYQEYQAFGGKTVVLSGWVRNNRGQKEFGFIDLNDGSFFETIQVVYEDGKIENFKDVQKFRVGSSVAIEGILELTPTMKQPFEIKARKIDLLGDSPEDYPIQPKRHSREFLRENAHLRMRTNLFNAVFRVRSEVSFAIHSFLNGRGYVYVHTPIVTGSDAEGAGEMFRVSNLDPAKCAGLSAAALADEEAHRARGDNTPGRPLGHGARSRRVRAYRRDLNQRTFRGESHEQRRYKTRRSLGPVPDLCAVPPGRQQG